MHSTHEDGPDYSDFVEEYHSRHTTTKNVDNNDYDQGIDAPEGAGADFRRNDMMREEVVWESSAARYEWKDEYGDVGPEVPELEALLFGEDPDERGQTGQNFSTLVGLKVFIESETKIPPIRSFGDAGLHPVMLGNVELSGFKVPTPIQQYCIPTILQGRDLLACAQTGSGKTAAFMLPILSKLMGKAKALAAPRPEKGQQVNYRAEPLVLVLAPTRELATQIFDESRRYCYRTMLRPCVVYGGAEIMAQRRELEKGCDILIATPGRLVDFLERGRALSLRRVKYAVIDEADQMLDMGFKPSIRRILLESDLTQDDDMQMAMFSATFPDEIREMAQTFLSDDHVCIRVGRMGSTHTNLIQRVLWIEEHQKQDELLKLLLGSPPSRQLIFCNNKGTVDTIDQLLFKGGFPVTSIHSDRTQREREDALRAFRSGKCPLMVATSVAARGLDVKNIMHVINFDMAKDIEEFVHRIGRTARMGNYGLATTFWTDRDMSLATPMAALLDEAKQEVPEWLRDAAEGRMPMRKDEDGNVIDSGNAGGDGWGADNNDGAVAAATGGDDNWAPAGDEGVKISGDDDWNAAPAASTTDEWAPAGNAENSWDTGNTTQKEVAADWW